MLAIAAPSAAADTQPFPGSTRSHYLTTTSTSVLDRAGRGDARATAAAGVLDPLAVLDAGDPLDSKHVRLPGSGRRSSYDEVRRAVVAYARGWQRVPAAPPLTLVVIVAAHGSAISRDTGAAWGKLVTRVAGSVDADVRGGLDVEVEWAPARAVRGWLGGYLAATARPFVDVGACTCPPFASVRGAWTLSDLAAVAWADGRGSVLPQIYANAGGNAKEWTTLARWAARHHRPPIRLVGVLTQQAACIGPPRRACAGIDASPRQAWRQLAEGTDQELRWATDIGYLPSAGAVHPSAIRAVLAAVVALALAAAVATLVLLAWRSRHPPTRRGRRRRRRRRRRV